MRKSYPLIDIFKIIGSIMIVALHTQVFKDVSENINFIYTNVISRVVVPIFFMSSSFLLFQKIDSINTIDSRKMKNILIVRYIKRLVYLYLIWSIIYIPMILGYIIHDGGRNPIVLIFNFLFTGIYSGSWYLVALILSICIIYVYTEYLKKNLNSLIVISFMLFSISAVSGFYVDIDMYKYLKPLVIFSEKFNWTIGQSIFSALIYACIGAKVVKIEERLKNGQSILINCTIVFFLYLAIKEVKFRDGIFEISDVYFSLLPLSVCIFLSLIYYNDRVDVNVPILYRKLSTAIYITHFYIYISIKVMLKISGIELNSILYFTVVLCLTIIISVILIKIQEKYCENNVLKYLI